MFPHEFLECRIVSSDVLAIGMYIGGMRRFIAGVVEKQRETYIDMIYII